MHPDSFRATLRSLINNSGLSMTQVAERCNTGPSTISELVSGKKQTLPSYKLLQCLSRAFNVSPAIFFDYKPIVPGELGLLPKSVLPLIDDPEFTRYLEAAVELYLAGVRHGQIKALVGILGHMTQK